MHEYEDSGYTYGSASDRNHSRMPKTDFPRFDEENPKWWKAVCEKYFTTYDVDINSWASFATMHFHGNATLWLTIYEVVNEIETWEELIVVVYSKFGKNKLLKHLEALERHKQKGSVEAYYQVFESLRVHKVLLHNKHYDEAFFVTKFVPGLKLEIRKAIRFSSYS